MCGCVCMYVCVREWVCTFKSVRLCMHVQTVFVNTRVCVCLYECMCVCV
jgi:hypothetical protein